MGDPATRPVRPRYGRIAVAASSTTVTLVAALGGVGAFPSAAQGPERDSGIGMVAERSVSEPGGEASVRGPVAGPRRLETTPGGSDAAARVAARELPRRSGDGRRVVFSEGRQRVWLVTDGEDVQRTYPVSGSVYDNLEPGTYQVYSRSAQAYGIDDSGTMRYFVRFAHGDNAAIGFHDIPVDEGERVQTPAELGTPLSHGCIRQRRTDAKALWDFAPLGTTVVVTA